MGYRSGQANLTERVFSQLTSLRASKAYQIESYFQTIRNHIQIMSEDPTVVDAMQEFTTAYSQLETTTVPAQFSRQLTNYYQNQFLPRLAIAEKGSPVLNAFLPETQAEQYLQYYYIAANPNPLGKKFFLNDARDNSQYSRVHARYHPIFRNIIQKFGYYDMFLINQKGTVVYTVYKETDFTSNLTTGPYNESNLARLVAQVRQAKQRDYASIVDFEAYAPSYGAPGAFIAVPIFKQSEFMGVLAIQLPADEINNVMTGNRNWERDGLGKTGETYLVGRDYLMRSVSRFLVENPAEYLKNLRSLGVDELVLKRIQQYKTSILENQLQTEASQQALAGKQGTRITKDYRGISVLSSYAPLQIDGLDWAILSEIDLTEAYAPTYSFGRQILISATLLMLLVTLLAMGLSYLFVKPINQLIKSARKVESGQLDTVAELNTDDEFGELTKSFNAMIYSLRTQTKLVEDKNRENEQLLLSVFPAAIAKRLKRGEQDIAENAVNVAVLFANLTGFSKLSESFNANELITILNDLVTSFDETAEHYGLQKIRTMGDSYLAICGLSKPYLDHDKRAIDFALEMLAIARRFKHERGFQFNVRIGIQCGDAIAGIVGRKKLIYDVWGDAVDQANELRLASAPGSILVSEEVYLRLEDLYEFEKVPPLESKSKVTLKAWQIQNVQKLRTEV